MAVARKKPTKATERKLHDLAARIEQHHQAACGAHASAIDNAIDCGKLLIEAKAKLRHGNWLPWLEEHTSVSTRQAQKYMRLAEHKAELFAGKYAPGSHLPLNEAIAQLAKAGGKKSNAARAAVEADERFAGPILELSADAAGDGEIVEEVTDPELVKTMPELEATIEPDIEHEDEQGRWRKDFMLNAELSATCGEHEDWSGYRVDSEVIDAAVAAADAWTATAQYLQKLLRQQEVPIDKDVPMPARRVG